MSPPRRVMRLSTIRFAISPWLLFNLADELSEQNNLVDTKKGKLEELIETLEEYDGEMMEPVF